jgi:DNA-binding transcriptional LysR family regulator
MKDPPELRELRLFIAVAEELHFRRAAARLGIAQPHLSQRIRQLEAKLGVRLLERTTRAVRLTPAGEQFLQRSRYALRQVEDAVVATRSFAAGRAGQLNVGFTAPAGFHILPTVLSEFRRRHPNVGLSLSYNGTATQVCDLVEGRINVGFLRLPTHTRRLSTLTLSREGFVAALPRTNPLAKRVSLRLEDLAKEDFVLFTPVLGVDFQEHAIGYCHRAGFAPRAAYEADKTNALIGFVAAGFGVAILPDYTRNVAHPRVVFRTLREIPALVDLGVAWVTDDPSPVTKAFREVIEWYMRANPID